MLVMRIILRKGGVAVPHHVLMIHIVVKASAFGISRIELVPTATALLLTSDCKTHSLLVLGLLQLLKALGIGKVIHRYLSRQERLLVRLTAFCQRGAFVVITALLARSDRRRAVQPGPLRAGGAFPGGVERLAKFL